MTGAMICGRSLNAESLPVSYLGAKHVRNQRAGLFYFRNGEIAVNLFACTASGNHSGPPKHREVL